MATRGLEATDLSVLGDADESRGPLPSSVPPFQQIYRIYFDFVWSLAMRFGTEPSAMDDLVQEVFVVIHAKLHTLQKPDALRSWIYSIVRRTVSHHRRARRNQAITSLAAGIEEGVPSTDPTPFEHTERNADLQLLASMLAELDEPKRELFALVELDELTVPEAAEALEIPLNTAYSRLRAARQAFESALARQRARSKGKL
jgi:RNA polymerase sigma-70 factor (ECF subfamily)